LTCRTSSSKGERPNPKETTSAHISGFGFLKNDCQFPPFDVGFSFFAWISYQAVVATGRGRELLGKVAARAPRSHRRSARPSQVRFHNNERRVISMSDKWIIAIYLIANGAVVAYLAAAQFFSSETTAADKTAADPQAE
jgi:hypothetical protein